MTIYQGMDVSSFQGTIDWSRVKASQIDFAMLRASAGWGRPEKQTDARFHRNVYEAAGANILLGAYHCSLAATADEAHREADCFLKVIQGYRFAYPVALDIEDRMLRYLKPDQLGAVVQAWCGDLRAAGYHPMVRAQLSSVVRRLNEQTLSEIDLWLMRFGDTPNYDGEIGIWQYTASGSVSGVRGRVTLDRAYRDYPTLIGEKGLNGFPAPAPIPESKSVTVPANAEAATTAVPSMTSLMQAFDTLSNLAAFRDTLKTLLNTAVGEQNTSTTQNIASSHSDATSENAVNPVVDDELITENELIIEDELAAKDMTVETGDVSTIKKQAKKRFFQFKKNVV